MIYEAVIANEGSEYCRSSYLCTAQYINHPCTPVQELGSVAGGGRYDNLIKMFSGNEVGCVGFSIGCERIFSLIASKLDMSKVRACHSQVLVASLGSVHIKEVLKLSNELRSSGVPTENLMKTGQNIQAYFSHCTRCVIPYIIFVGPKELESNMFAIKYALKGSKSTPSQNVIVKRHELAHKLKEMISAGAANLSENSLDIYYC